MGWLAMDVAFMLAMEWFAIDIACMLAMGWLAVPTGRRIFHCLVVIWRE